MFKDKKRLNTKRYEKVWHAESNQKRARVATLTTEKIDFKTKYRERQRRTFYNGKSVSPLGGYKHRCI